MSFQGIVGKINDHYEMIEFVWEIQNFFSLVQTVDNRYHSPAFDCWGYSFYLQMYPNGEKRTESEGWISLYLVLRERCPSIEVDFEFAIKTAEGGIVYNTSQNGTFEKKGKGWGVSQFLHKDILLSRKNEWAPADVLTIVVTLETGTCQMDLLIAEENTTDAYVQTDLSYFKNSYSKEEIQQVKTDSNDVYVQTDNGYFEKSYSKEEIQDVKTATFNKSVQVHFENRMCEEIKNKQPEKAGSEKLLEDIAKVWYSVGNSDVVVRIQNVELQAHKVILSARSPVLFAMFQHDTAENRSGEIKINDCHPTVFREFLHYIYTGGPQELTSRNAAALYKVAEKYLADDLKGQCLEYVRSNLSVDTFCQAVTLALNYGETELLQHATDFASKNIRQIIKSVEWQRFNQDEPATANEILIKALGS